MLHCQLPRAFRRLARPSSPVIAKASTTCTYVLDPITLHPSCIKYLVRTRPVAGSRTERALVVANAITRTSALRPMRFFTFAFLFVKELRLERLRKHFRFLSLPNARCWWS